jgi:hypothetical protein
MSIINGMIFLGLMTVFLITARADDKKGIQIKEGQ